SLHIPHGKKIAVLGKSGAEKSTLVKLMAGLVHPDEGKITLNEHPMEKTFLSTAVSVLNQKPHLFDATIENNLRIGKPEASEEEIWHVVTSTVDGSDRLLAAWTANEYARNGKTVFRW